MRSWQLIGKHRIRIEEDVVYVVIQGDIQGDEVVTLCEELTQIQRQYGLVFDILDATAAGGMSAEARRQVGEWYRQNHLEIEIAVFGASRLLRTLFSLMTNALRMLSRNHLLMHFVATESEAKAWVAERRDKKHSTAGSR